MIIPVAMIRARLGITILPAHRGAGAGIGRHGLQSDPIALYASREESLEGVTGPSGQNCSSFFIEHA